MREGIDPTDLVVRQLEVHTVFGAPPDAWAHTVRVFGAGLLDPARWSPTSCRWTSSPRPIELVGGGDPKVGKVLLRPWRTAGTGGAPMPYAGTET